MEKNEMQTIYINIDDSGKLVDSEKSFYLCWFSFYIKKRKRQIYYPI